ncbi:MAG: hypothetical protein ABJO27_23680 [Pseudoruegeria sp.]
MSDERSKFKELHKNKFGPLRQSVGVSVPLSRSAQRTLPDPVRQVVPNAVKTQQAPPQGRLQFPKSIWVLGRIAVPVFRVADWVKFGAARKYPPDRKELETLFERELRDFKTAYIRRND